jgi:hypothetical protein
MPSGTRNEPQTHTQLREMAGADPRFKGLGIADC